MRSFRKIVFLDLLFVFIGILLFREKSFPIIGIGIVVFGILLLRYCNHKPN